MLAHYKQSAGIHVAPLGHIIPIKSQPVFAGLAKNSKYQFDSVWFEPTEPTILEVNIPTNTPPFDG